tara:strand:- start:186 stop:611 length:426 start_codon:yes stop_codon:yes gene_type:complete
MSDLDTLLDTKLDDLADLPEFKSFPRGAHRVLATFAMKEINDKPAVDLSFTLIETEELSDPQDAMPKAGDVSSTMFMLGNEFGVGNLKKCALPFQEALQLETIRDVIDQVKDVECIIVTSLRADKNDKEKFYLVVKEIAVV